MVGCHHEWNVEGHRAGRNYDAAGLICLARPVASARSSECSPAVLLTRFTAMHCGGADARATPGSLFTNPRCHRRCHLRPRLIIAARRPAACSLLLFFSLAPQVCRNISQLRPRVPFVITTWR